MCVNDKLDYLNRLMEYLIINNVNVIDNGLYHGKMGMVICLCEYARYINDDAFRDLAEDLLDEILSEIDVSVPVNYENGLCGIGWGIEYLIRHNYMSGNSDEVLGEFDIQVMQIDTDRVVDFSIETGLGGIALYIIARMTAMDRTADNIVPFDLAYLDNWRRLLTNCLYEGKCTPNVLEVFAKLLSLLHNLSNISKESLNLPSFICSVDSEKFRYTPLSFIPKGLCGGIAGMALQLMQV